MNASKNLDEMREIAARICRDYLTGAWKMITADEIQLKRISGGLSNFLYYVSLPDNMDNNNERTNVKRLRKETSRVLTSEPKEVLLRIYGQMHGEQAMETVLTDTVVFTLLSERKLGPKLHGIFPGGRIEQYIPARPLTTVELSDARISSKIAEKMAAIHSLNIPVSKEPEWLWKTMARWLQSSESVLAAFQSSNAGERTLFEQIRSFDFRAELDWLKQTIEHEDFPVVFSHNDLQEGNILFREDAAASVTLAADANIQRSVVDCMQSSQFDDAARGSSSWSASAGAMRNTASIVSMADAFIMQDIDSSPNASPNAFETNLTSSRKRMFSLNMDDIDPDNTRDSVLSDGSQTFCDAADDPALMIIDFEYCAYNYRGFDLANHFVEWTMDYTNKEFPFFWHRCEQYPTREQQEHFVNAYLKAVSGCCMDNAFTPAVDDVNELLDEVRCFRMASHLFWTLWAIVNVHQDIEFGYWQYAVCRLNQYLAAKEEFTKHKGLSLKRKQTIDKQQ